VKIELETSPRAPLRPPVRDLRPRPEKEAFLTPMKLVKWFVAILVLGQVCWWVYQYVQNTLAGKS
jgi:hypothetical protein